MLKKIGFQKLSWAWLMLVILNICTHLVFKAEICTEIFFLLLYVYLCGFAIQDIVTHTSGKDRIIQLLWQLAFGVICCVYEYLRGKMFTGMALLAVSLMAWNIFAGQKEVVSHELSVDMKAFVAKMIKGQWLGWASLIYLVIFLYRGVEIIELVFFWMYFYISMYIAEYAHYREKEQTQRRIWLLWQFAFGVSCGIFQCLTTDLQTAVIMGLAVLGTLFILFFQYMMRYSS